MLIVAILIVALVAQLGVLALALRIVNVEGQGLTRTLLLAAMALMAVRSIVTLYLVVSEQSTTQLSLASEVIGLLVSVLVLAAVARLGPLVQSMRQAEEKIRVSEDRLSKAQRLGRFGHWQYEFDTARLEWSAEALELFGVKDDEPELTYERCLEMVHPEDLSKLQQAIAESVPGDARYDYVVRILEQGGAIGHLRIMGEVIYDDEGAPTLARGTALDVTGQQRHEQELARYQRIIADSLNEIYMFDAQSLKFIYVNDEARRNLGYTLEEMQDLTPIDIKPFYNAESFAELTAPLYREQLDNMAFETVHQRKDGSRYDVEVHLQRLRYAEEDICAAIILDISERKQAERERARLEAEVRRAQKFESLGTLAGGIAHDFNNILSPILGFAELAMQRLTPADPVSAHLDQIGTAARRAKDLVAQILLFSRRVEKERVPLSLDNSVDEALKLLRPSIPATVNIHWQPPPLPVTVLADETQIQQLILNLCANAWQAMEQEGGDLHISLEDADLVGDEFLLNADLPKDQEYVCLRVRDTGPGMDEVTMERIFEPFFSTKDVDAGTGLGLAVVHGIVQSYGGDVAVTSKPGVGTTFLVYLPAHDGRVEESLEYSTAIRGGRERILIVDDDPAIGIMLEEMLVGLGYQVQLFKDSGKALEVFTTQAQAYDLLIADLTMPIMTGVQLAEKIHMARPDLPIVILTGHPDSTVSPAAREAVGIEKVLLKPVGIDTLTRTVREILDANYKQGASVLSG